MLITAMTPDMATIKFTSSTLTITDPPTTANTPATTIKRVATSMQVTTSMRVTTPRCFGDCSGGTCCSRSR